MAMYNNPYQYQMPQYQTPMQRTEIIHVNGENGARAMQLAPNSNALLLDDTAPIVWLVQTDGAGYKTVTPYTITPDHAEPHVDLKAIDERLKKVEDILNAKPDHTSARKKSSDE